MTRFREEVYAARWYKALVRRERNQKAAVADEWREIRAQYFQKSLAQRAGITRSQRKASKTQGSRLDGF